MLAQQAEAAGLGMVFPSKCGILGSRAECPCHSHLPLCPGKGQQLQPFPAGVFEVSQAISAIPAFQAHGSVGRF